MIPISETVVDHRGLIVCALDHDGYPTVIDPLHLIGGHIMDTSHLIRNALDLNQAAILSAEHGSEAHLPIYYKNGSQRVAHISPLPQQRAVIQIWAIKEAC